MQLGGIPRPSDLPGKIFWLLWMVCQVSQILIISFALALVICGYLVVQSQLRPCMVTISVPFGFSAPVSLLNAVASAAFVFHPMILTKLLTLLVYCSACFHGIIAWEDSNPSEGQCFPKCYLDRALLCTDRPTLG